MEAQAAQFCKKPLVPAGFNSVWQERLYRFCLIAGLGPRARFLARLAETASQGAWHAKRSDNDRGINAGSPLEFSLRSGRSGDVNFASVVGTDAMPASERLLLGVESAVLLEQALKEKSPPVFFSLKYPIQSWLSEQNHGYGRFGSYIGMRLGRNEWKLNLYLDLFARRYNREALESWAALMETCGVNFRYPHYLAELIDVATPSMGCILVDSNGTVGSRLYWRMREYTHETMERVCSVFHIAGEVHRSIEHIIQQASDDKCPRHLTVGFVHETPVADGRLGFYSTAPSRWACTIRKRQQIQRLWQAYGGQPLALSRVWQLAGGWRRDSILPTLTIIGADADDQGVRGLSAYFCPKI
jgi:hypothetical protein